MKKFNEIINYFAHTSSSPFVFKSPVTMTHELAYDLLSRQLKKQDKAVPQGPLFHTCFDVDSKTLYAINKQCFTVEEFKRYVESVRNKIVTEYGKINENIIKGSPFSLLRSRKLSDFTYSFNYLKKNHNSIQDIPVIEANLDRMTPTLKSLPQYFFDTRYATGGYISSKYGEYINFIENKDVNGKNKNNTLILRQKTPFILVNIAVPKMQYTDKEHIVITSAYDYLLDINNSQDIIIESLMAQVKHLMYVGYPFEEICSIFLSPIKKFEHLLSAGVSLMSIAKELENDGYENPSLIPYYITFKVNLDNFVIDLKSIMENGSIDSNRQIGFFKIIEYDLETKFIIIETPLFIDQEICQKIFNSDSFPIITKYNPAMNTIDVKSNGSIFKEYKNNNRNQIAKLKSLTDFNVSKLISNYKNDTTFRSDSSSRSISLSNPYVFNLRKISDYRFATDQIKKLCISWNKKYSTNFEFEDIIVFIGPIEILMGRGTQGGYMDEDAFEKSKLKLPFEICKGIFVSPPLIAVNSESKPSYAEQTDTLVHEYAHHLYSKTFPDKEIPEYIKQKKLQETDNKKWFSLYLSDPNERLAHKYQMRHLLMSGVTPDEIIREKFNGIIDMDNYTMAIIYKDLVNEAIGEIKNE